MPATYAEYLAFQEASSDKHEYRDGEIYERAAGTPDHAALAAAILSIIGSQLTSDCLSFTSDLRIRVVATGLSTYPDGTVVCRPWQRAVDDSNALTNPIVLIEVTSNSSEDYDRGDKLQHYQTIPTVREILIISHREPRVTVYRREDESRWTSSEARAGESIRVGSVGAVIQVDDLYRDGLEDAV